MNIYQLAALQLHLLLGNNVSAEWTATVSARSGFSGCIITPGWLRDHNSASRFESVATDKQYCWNVSNIPVQIEMCR